MFTMCTGAFKVIHVYGHNLVPENEEADRLAKAGVQMSVVHKVRRRQWSTDGQQEGRKQKFVQGRGIKWQVAVQVVESSSKDSTRLVRDQHRRKWQGPLKLPDPEPE